MAEIVIVGGIPCVEEDLQEYNSGKQGASRRRRGKAIISSPGELSLAAGVGTS